MKNQILNIKPQKFIFILLIILAVAGFFRLWQLDSIPPGLYPDEAINGNEAISNPGQIFYPENNGREGLFINLISLSFSIFGISIWSLKIVPAIIGILTVFGLYLLTKELFTQWNENNARSIALLSSFFLATSFWHVSFSRIGFRGILVPFILTFSFYFLFKAFRTKKIWAFVLSGIIFGLGFYTYISFRLSVLLLLIVLLSWLFIYFKEKQTKKILLFTPLEVNTVRDKSLNGVNRSRGGCRHPLKAESGLLTGFTVYCLLFTIIVALPIGIYFLQNPEFFASRAAGVSIFAQENPIKAFSISLIKHLAMFNFYGDYNWRHNFAGSPQLLWPIGILFLMGFFLLVKDLFLKWKNKNCFRLQVSGFMLGWFFIMLLPGILTSEGIPHALRTIGVIPVVYIFAAFGTWFLFEKLKNFYKSKNLKLAVYCLLFTVLLTVGYAQFHKYFYSWANHPETEVAFSKNYVEIGNYLNSLPPEIQKYVIVNQSGVPVPYPTGPPMPAQTVMFIENINFLQPQSTYLLPENLDQIKINKRKTVIVPMNYDQELFSKLQIMFPRGKIRERDGVWIYNIKIPSTKHQIPNNIQ